MNQAEQQPRKLLTIESSDRDELSEYFSKRVSKVAISPTSQSGDVTISATVIPLGSAVAFQAQIPLGARFRQAEDLDGFFVLLPISSGRALWKTGTKEIICDRTTGFVGPMNEKDTMDCVGPWEHLVLKVTNDQLTRNLSHLLDQPIVDPLEFDPTLDLNAAPAKVLASMMWLALTPHEGEAAFSKAPVAAAQFSESLALLLLENFRHSYSYALSSGAPNLKPRHVRRAIEYMRANAGRPLTLQDIAAAAGVSVRALHYGFKQFLGMSPFENLRQIRLEAAHADLMQASETTSVAEIARKWGFPNAGRFALHIKRGYGKSPSEIRQLAFRSRRLR